MRYSSTVPDAVIVSTAGKEVSAWRSAIASNEEKTIVVSETGTLSGSPSLQTAEDFDSPHEDLAQSLRLQE